jgi:hypothetical protein
MTTQIISIPPNLNRRLSLKSHCENGAGQIHSLGGCNRRYKNEIMAYAVAPPLSPKNEREAPGFRHGEESDSDFSRLEIFLKPIAIAIFFVNRFAILVANTCYSPSLRYDIKTAVDHGIEAVLYKSRLSSLR